MSYEYSEDELIGIATQQVLEELGREVTYAWTKETFGASGLFGWETKVQALQKTTNPIPIHR